VTGIVADAGGNVTDLSTRLSGELYVLLAEVDLPGSVDPEQLSRDLAAVGSDLGVDVSLQVLDPDVL
jgi:glycine cleavage system transcriptional repressor